MLWPGRRIQGADVADTCVCYINVIAWDTKCMMVILSMHEHRDLNLLLS